MPLTNTLPSVVTVEEKGSRPKAGASPQILALVKAALFGDGTWRISTRHSPLAIRSSPSTMPDAGAVDEQAAALEGYSA